jgi:hypothetical protein
MGALALALACDVNQVLLRISAAYHQHTCGGLEDLRLEDHSILPHHPTWK